MATTIDELDIQISVNVDRASKSIDSLINKIDLLSNSIGVIGKNANANFTNVTKNFNNLSKSIPKVYTSTQTASNGIGKIAKRLVSLAAVIKGINKLSESIENTADYVDAFNYFTVAMGKIASKWDENWENYGDENARNYSNKFFSTLDSEFKKLSGVSYDPKSGLLSETGLKNLGLNLQEVTQYAGQLASMMDAIGQTGETTLATTKAFTKLAGDVSSLYNIDYSEAANKIRSVLQGQSRAGYGFGWDTTMASLQALADRLDLSKPVSEMQQYEKQQLRILSILEQSKVAWGDQANTINTLANQIRIFKNNISEVSMTLGQLFYPILTKIMPIINGFTIAIKRLLGTIASFFGIKIKETGQGYSDLGDSIGGVSDSLDDVAKSAKKANAGLRAFDELKVINAPDTSGTGTTGGVSGGIDLTDEILKATEEYQKIWQEAFDKMESAAQKWADKIEKVFEPIKSIFKDISIGDFFNLGKDTSKLVENIFNFITSAMQSVDWVDIGSKIGEFLRGINFLAVFESIKETVVTALESALALWFGSLKEAPIETALITAISLWKFTKFGQEIGKKIWDAIPGEYTKDIGIKIAAITLTWEIGFDIGKEIGKLLFPEDAEYYDNFKWFGEGGFFEAVFPPEDDMKEHIRTWIMGWGVIGGYIEDWWNESVAPWFTKQKWNDEFKNIGEALGEAWNRIVSWWNNTAIVKWFNNNVAPWFTKQKWLATFNKAKEGLKEGWNSFKEWFNGIAIVKWWNNLIGYFRADKWTFSGIKEGLSSAWNNAIEAVKGIWNTFATWLNEKLVWKIDPIVKGGITVFEGMSINLGKIPTFATGGFPEDGLFMANHGELVGQFSNGRTAVANNEQITEGIKQGVKEAVSEILAPYLADIAQNTRETANKEFGITESAIGKAARNYAKDYTTRTGRPAYT